MTCRSWICAIAATVSVTAIAPLSAESVVTSRTIYLDFSMSEFTAEARDNLDDFLGEWRKSPALTIRITAHTDRVGSALANQRLSLQRAAQVKRYFVGKGVPAAKVIATGRGESEPALPTADGVREPINRRVVIELVMP